MRRRVALNLNLALLLAGLAVLVVLAPSGKKPEPQLPLVSAPPGDVHSIQVERAGKPALRFAREENVWALRAPVVAPAHPHRIRELLAVRALPASARLEINGNDLPRFGLDPPLATLRLDDDTFEFGTTDGLDGRRYIHYHRQVHLVPDTIYLRLTQDANFFIDTRLLKEGLRPERISAPHRVVWLQDGTWQSDPVTAAGEPPADSIARAWQDAQALTVRIGADLDGGQRITLTFAQGMAIEFDVVERDGSPVLLRRDLNLRYHLDPEQARSLMLVSGAAVAVPAPR